MAGKVRDDSSSHPIADDAAFPERKGLKESHGKESRGKRVANTVVEEDAGIDAGGR